jgi:hypothetical protein
MYPQITIKILTKIGPDQSHNNCGRLGIAPLALTLQEGCPRGTYADIIEEAYTKPVGKAPGAAIDDMQAAESERPNEAY